MSTYDCTPKVLAQLALDQVPWEHCERNPVSYVRLKKVDFKNRNVFLGACLELFVFVVVLFHSVASQKLNPILQFTAFQIHPKEVSFYLIVLPSQYLLPNLRREGFSGVFT